MLGNMKIFVKSMTWFNSLMEEMENSNATDSAMARGPHADTSKLYGIQDESFKVQKYFDDNDMDLVLRQAIHRNFDEEVLGNDEKSRC
ncbi:hypothetical protein AgCh_014840 [Apium graveolens]